jgi:hypothetical protein
MVGGPVVRHQGYSGLLIDIDEELLPGGKFLPLRPTKSTMYTRAATALQPRRRRTAMSKMRNRIR